MTPVKQTIFGAPRGDCLRACVASILDLPLTAVPNFADPGPPVRPAVAWLQKRGFTCLRMDLGDTPKTIYASHQGEAVYCIVGGVSPRSTPENKLYHVVVGQANGWGFKLVHDPHPDNTFLAGDPDFVLWLFKTRDGYRTHRFETITQPSSPSGPAEYRHVCSVCGCEDMGHPAEFPHLLYPVCGSEAD